MDDRQKTLQSRRTLLAAAGAGAAALVAQALGRPAPALATHTDVHLGAENITDTVTKIQNVDEGEAGLWVVSENGTSIVGSVADYGAGVEGHGGPAGYGVKGYGGYVGVYGESTTGSAVFGWSSAAAAPAILGQATGGSTGIQALSWTGDLPAAPDHTAVHGATNGDEDSRAVAGSATAGRGVSGTSTTGVGVHASSGARGRAFEADGRVSFSTSGLVDIPAGASNRVVNPGSAVSPGSRVLCTLESNQAGLSIHRVTKDPTADTFRVFLSAAVQAGKTAKVAWFVIG